MREYEIVHIALENLQKNVGITGNWEEHGLKEIDGKMELLLDKKTLKFNVEAKQELRNHQMPKIIERAKHLGPTMVVANRIFPKIKEELKQHEIAYLEANGNIWLRQKGTFIWVETQQPLPGIKNKGNRGIYKHRLESTISSFAA